MKKTLNIISITLCIIVCFLLGYVPTKLANKQEVDIGAEISTQLDNYFTNHPEELRQIIKEEVRDFYIRQESI